MSTEFIQLLYESAEAGWLTLWTKGDKKTYWFEIDQLEQAAKAAEQMASTDDVYFGVALRGRRAEMGRGSNEDVIAIPGLWVDIDIAGPAHKETNLPPDMDSAIEMLRSFPLEPSLLVNSGNGLHAYWLFKELWELETEEERREAADTMERFQGAIRQIFAGKGWKLDPTHDLARVLRLPNTLNHKTSPPKAVQIVHHAESRYNPSDFEPYLPAELPRQVKQNTTTYAPNEQAGQAKLILENCKFIQHCRDNAATLSEPEWYAMVTNVARARDGAKLVHELSKPYKGYNAKETDSKIHHALVHGQPHTCAYIRQTLTYPCPEDGCGVTAPCAFALSRVTRAKTVLSKLDVEKIDPQVAYSEEVLGALATLKDVDPGEYALTKEKFRGKVNLNDLERAVNKAATRQRLRVLESEESAPRVPLNEAMPDLPIENIYGPPGWTVNENGLWSRKMTKDGPIDVCACMVPVLLTKRLRNVETGEERIELTYRRDGKWRYIAADRATVASRQGLIMLANRGLPVNSENAKFLIQFLDDLERENRDSIPVVRSIGRMGWIGKNAFLPGAEGDIELDVDETSGAASVAGAYKECGSFEHWVKEMGEIRRSYPLARFMLSASFAAPLLRIVGQRVFIVHAWGPSRGGKTAALKAALSVWGNAEELIASFNATRVGLERMASFYGDLPLGVDERQVVGDKQGFVEGLVYMLGSGRGKVRGAKGGGLQQVQSWRTIVLTTGEQPLSTGSSNAGIKTRTLELYGKPIDDEDLASKLHDTTRDIYGLAGPRFVRQLIDTFGEDGEKLKQEYDTFKGLLSKQFASNSSSHVQAVATVALADYYASQWIFMQDEEEAVTQALDLAELALGQLETAADADDGQRAYEFFISWYGVHRANFEGDRALQRYGRIDHSDINLLLVYPHIFEEALTEGGFNPDRILRDWADRGWLEQQAGKDGQKRMKIRRRDDGRLTYFVGVRLPREAYEE